MSPDSTTSDVPHPAEVTPLGLPLPSPSLPEADSGPKRPFQAISEDLRARLARAIEAEEVVHGRVLGMRQNGILARCPPEFGKVVVYLAESPRTLDAYGKQTSPDGDEGVAFVITKVSASGRITGVRHAVSKGAVRARALECIGAVTVGQECEGVVVGVQEYGAFVEVDGVVGLLHASEMAWEGQRDARSLVKIGETLRMVIAEIDVERARLSFSRKPWLADPWPGAEERYPVGDVVHGRVTQVREYGVHVDFEDGVSGIVKARDLSWDASPGVLVEVGQEIDVLVMKVDETTRRIELSLRMLRAGPWDHVDDLCRPGQGITGTVCNVVDFGLFVEIAPGLDGLAHVSQIAGLPEGVRLRDLFTKDAPVDVVVTFVHKEERRLELSASWPQPQHDVAREAGLALRASRRAAARAAESLATAHRAAATDASTGP